MIDHGHFPADFGLARDPPDPDLKPDYSERFHLPGYNRIQQEEAYSSTRSGPARTFRGCC